MANRYAYCEDCEWTASADGGDRIELNYAMIDHFVGSGHTIVATDSSPSETIDTGSDSDSMIGANRE